MSYVLNAVYLLVGSPLLLSVRPDKLVVTSIHCIWFCALLEGYFGLDGRLPEDNADTGWLANITRHAIRTVFLCLVQYSSHISCCRQFGGGKG